MSAMRRQPVLVVVDDIHVADVASLALLRFLVPRLGAARGVVVATYREPGCRLRCSGSELSLGVRATSLTLSGLRREELGQLRSRLSGEPANARLVE